MTDSTNRVTLDTDALELLHQAAARKDYADLCKRLHEDSDCHHPNKPFCAHLSCEARAAIEGLEKELGEHKRLLNETMGSLRAQVEATKAIRAELAAQDAKIAELEKDDWRVTFDRHVAAVKVFLTEIAETLGLDCSETDTFTVEQFCNLIRQTAYDNREWCAAKQSEIAELSERVTEVDRLKTLVQDREKEIGGFVGECLALRSENANYRRAHEDALTLADALRAEVAKLKTAQEWRPIAEAPKDGTRVKVRGGSFGTGCAARYRESAKRWLGSTNQHLRYYEPPTEWMPLPPPPKGD